jgi:hypothetical protein
MRALLIPSLLYLLLAAPAPADDRKAAEIEPKGYVCGRASGPIEIDGKLDEPSWEKAPWTDAFVDIEGDVRPRPRFRTRAKMLWDDKYFYVAAELEEPHVWGTLTKHDSVIFQDNDFEIFIDPDGDHHQYYELEINALNTEWDLRLGKPYRDGGPALNEWEVPGLKTATHVNGTLNDPSDTDTSWSVEFAIPWKVLAEYANRPSPPKNGDRWRVNFSRVEWQVKHDGKTYSKVPGTREDNWVWTPQGAIDMHRPERWGEVLFTTAPPGETKFTPDPTMPARDLLMDVYRAQHGYRGKHKRWANSFDGLGLAGKPLPPGVSRPSIKATDKGFEATVTVTPAGGGEARTLTIRQDSRLTDSAVKDAR